MFQQLNAEFGKESPLTVQRGKVHEYLGMIVDYSVDGKVSFTMPDLTTEILKQLPDELLSGPSTTPAANPLFHTKPSAEKLGATHGRGTLSSHDGAITIFMQASKPGFTDGRVVPLNSCPESRRRQLQETWPMRMIPEAHQALSFDAQ